MYEADSLVAARRLIESQPLDVALIDMRLSQDARNRDGLVLVEEIRARTAIVPIIVTAYQEVAEIRMAMRVGAYDYILKDDLCDELVLPVLTGVSSRRRLEHELRELRARRADGEPVPSRLVGVSTAMEFLRETIRRAALSDRPVLVMGPTGSGKELVVEALHALGPHPDQPLLDVNCGAIPEALMESQLFGHIKGAFTGADQTSRATCRWSARDAVSRRGRGATADVAVEAAARAGDRRVSARGLGDAGPVRRPGGGGDARRSQ